MGNGFLECQVFLIDHITTSWYCLHNWPMGLCTYRLLNLAFQLLNFNLTYGTLWTSAGGGLLILILEKFSLFRLATLITLVSLMWKWMVLFLRENHPLGCWDNLSLLNWIGPLILSSLLKLPFGPTLAASLEKLDHHRNVASWSPFYRS